MPVRLSKGTRQKVAMLVVHYALSVTARPQLHPIVERNAKALREKTMQRLVAKYQNLLSVQSASIFEHGTDEYNKLLQGAKVGPLF